MAVNFPQCALCHTYSTWVCIHRWNLFPHTSLSTRCHSHHMTHTEDASVPIHLPRNCPYLLRAMAQWVRHPRFIPGLKQFVGRTSSIPTSGDQLSTVCTMSHLQYLSMHPNMETFHHILRSVLDVIHIRCDNSPTKILQADNQ